MPSRSLMLRVAFDIVILVCVLNGWWFFALPMSVYGTFSFSYFFEFIVAGVVYDALFGMVKDFSFWGYVGTIISIMVYIVLIMAKRLVRR